MIKKENYVQISGWMISELNLSGNELIAYALIHGFSQDGKSVWFLIPWLFFSYTIIDCLSVNPWWRSCLKTLKIKAKFFKVFRKF